MLEEYANFLFPQHNILNHIFVVSCNGNISVSEDKRTLVQFPYFNVISKITDGKECYILLHLINFFEKIKPKITNYECFKSVMYDDKNIPQTDFKTIDDLKKFKEGCKTLKGNYKKVIQGTDNCYLTYTDFDDLKSLINEQTEDFLVNFVELKIGTIDTLQAQIILNALMDFFESLLTVERQNKKKVINKMKKNIGSMLKKIIMLTLIILNIKIV